MIHSRARLFAAVLGMAALAAAQPYAASAQALDMTGTWTMQVQSQNGPATPTMTLQQSGTTLTGHYSSETLGEHDVMGTVSGRNATVTFEAEIEGLGEAPLAYSGSVSAEGVWSGDLTADVQGQSFPIGTFTATKSGQ